MKKKSIIFTLLCLMTISSCTSYKTTIDSFDNVEYQNDLNHAISLSILEFDDDKSFNIQSFVTNTQTGNIYTLQISYKNVTLESFKAIMFPHVTTIDTSKTYPSIGYTGDFKLTEHKNVNDNSYPGYNLSYKSSEVNEFNLFISYADEEYVFLFDNFVNLGD